MDPGAQDAGRGLGRLLEEDAADLYENAPCGYLSMLPDGRIVKANRTFCAWIARPAAAVVGMRLEELLAVGSRVFLDTHLRPLLRMQGVVQEVALDMVRADGTLLPCVLNAVEVCDDDGAQLLVRATLFDATARRRYEQQLLTAQRVATESEARSRVVQRVVSDLAAATSVRDVAAVILDSGRTALRARGAALVLVDEFVPAGEDPQLHTEQSVGIPPELIAALRTAAGPQFAGELARDVRTVELGDRLRAARPEVASAMDAAGLARLVLVPVAADGRRLGVLVLGLAPARAGELISLDDRESVEEPADLDVLRMIGRQAGQALERARLHEETERQAQRAAFLLEAARLLGEAADVRETVERLAGLVVERLAELCVIDLVTEEGTTRPAVRHRDPARQHLADALREMHLPQRPAPHPSVRALREGGTQWVRLVDDAYREAMAFDERHLEVARDLALTSIIAVPLTADGRHLGVLTLGTDRSRRPFSAADVEVAEQLAMQVSLVVAKAQRYELDVRTSHTLQDNLLPPPPPALDGLSMAVRYLAATHGVEVGGDFYDVVALPDGQVALAVGDVVGHDITAAATMGQLNSVYRALLVDRPAPSGMIDRLQASWSLLGLQRMATALFATLDPGTGRLRIASAGHLSPLLFTDGRAEFLPVRPSRMLGAPPAPAPALEWSGVLPAGATLVLFTDGLVESRTADLDEGLDRLIAAVDRAGTSDPDELCDRLLAELTGAHRADDIALLVLTRT